MSKYLEITVDLVGTTPYSSSRAISTVKETGEKHEAFEERTWPEKMHTNEAGEIFIPPMAFKKCIEYCAKYIGETIPGQGKKTYTNKYKAGMMCIEPLMLGVNIKDVQSEKLFVPSNGQAGGGTRVWKRFPFIPEHWETTATLLIMDPTLADSEDAIRRHIEYAGQFVGLGRYRPENGGFYGRFKVTKFEVKTTKL